MPRLHPHLLRHTFVTTMLDAGVDGPAVESELAATAILDGQDPLVADLLARIRADGPAAGVGFLRAAHRRIEVIVRPVYSLNERQPASRTLRRRRGSCSQRLAVLEAVARAAGIPTRVRGLLVEGSFWHPRFPRARLLLPDRVVLAWPAFHLDGTWIEAGELFGDLTDLAADPGSGFTNTTGETLFDAVARTAVDWNGQTSTPGGCSSCDLSEVGCRSGPVPGPGRAVRRPRPDTVLACTHPGRTAPEPASGLTTRQPNAGDHRTKPHERSPAGSCCLRTSAHGR
jgi:Transglutaminase-like superfamily